jgi:hypothetical protein
VNAPGAPATPAGPRSANGPLAVVDVEVDGQVPAYCVGGLVLDVPAKSIPALVGWTLREAGLGQPKLSGVGPPGRRSGDGERPACGFSREAGNGRWSPAERAGKGPARDGAAVTARLRRRRICAGSRGREDTGQWPVSIAIGRR